jgi:hypothetical protein
MSRCEGASSAAIYGEPTATDTSAPSIARAMPPTATGRKLPDWFGCRRSFARASSLPSSRRVNFPLGAGTTLVVKEAIREAQALVPEYTYKGFVAKIARAGCAGYIVSFLGRCVLYFGRTAETHVEPFPGSN